MFAEEGTGVSREDHRIVRAGERTNASGKPVKNKILLAIRDGEFHLLRHHLEYVDLPHHRSLHEPHQKLTHAYFPNSGLVSLVVATEDGRTVEAGVVGVEGMAGIPLAVGLVRSPLREVMQIAGDGFRVKSNALQKTLEVSPHLRVILGRYAVVQGIQIAQTAACNRLHDITQRLSRWLLMAQDRVDSGLVSLTHDFLATMLGTDRSSVSLAAGALQKKKIIHYMRGAVKILNRRELEGCACECYGVIQQFNGELGLK
jgi:CRP-like cAMP-binding protein